MDNTPLKPDVLVDALQDRIGPASGRLLAEKPVIPMGAPHGPRIPADAALIWSRQKPVTPGWYAWRVGGKVYPYLTQVYLDGETLMADMRDGSWDANHELADVSDREWFGPLPD